MKQLSQKLKDGHLNIIEVPIPQYGDTEILVRNSYSCISAGTESSTVKAARKGYLGKAKDKPQQLLQVLESLRAQGPVETYRKVMKKLDAHSPLGYSCSGEIIAVGKDVTDMMPGDMVACGGSSACHAEIVAVPRSLCVKVPHRVSVQHAAYTTLGAIALQGIRQADLRLGETCCVIGLGLLGQLTCHMLRAAGVRVLGVDLDPNAIKTAGDHCVDEVFLRHESGTEKRIIDCCEGKGCDAVIITAGSTSLDPINFSGAIARQKANIVIVGAVPTGFDREPHFYRKELSVRMSCSYGPGRYDPDYEVRGHDYPYGYVRWTERRNMQAFLRLIADNKIDIGYMTSHVLRLEDAPQAYEIILNRSEPYLGMLIEYISANSEKKDHIIPLKVKKREACSDVKVSIGFIGAGSYAQGSLLPNIPVSDEVALRGVMTKTPAASRSVADRFKFDFCTSDPRDIFENPQINTVFIATPHNTHGRYVIDALQAGKNVFVEKPLCLKIDELNEITKLMQQDTLVKQGNILLMVGYNRRFAPLTQQIKSAIKPGPLAAIYTVNAGSISSDSWIQDPDIGGGRIHGEACHFIDYLTFLTESLPISVSASVMKTALNLEDTVSIMIRYENGSIGNIHYFSNGGRGIPKERVEVFQDGSILFLNDFRELSIFGGRKPTNKKLLLQDKGQRNEIHQFIDTIIRGKPAPIPYTQLYSTTLTTISAIQSIRKGNSVAIAFGHSAIAQIE